MVWAWQSLHPIAGIVVGLLTATGIGWWRVGTGSGALTRRFHPSGRHLPEFLTAWEATYGDAANRPPRGTFRRWIKDRARTGVPAAAWLRGESLPSRAEVEALATDAARLAPHAYPDGRPFPGADHADRLLGIMQLVSRLNIADTWRVALATRDLLRCLCDLERCTEPDSHACPSPALTDGVAAAGEVLVRTGMSDGQRELAEVLATIREYWDQRGAYGTSLPDAS